MTMKFDLKHFSICASFEYILLYYIFFLCIYLRYLSFNYTNFISSIDYFNDSKQKQLKTHVTYYSEDNTQ